MKKLIITILFAVSSMYGSAQNNLTIVIKGLDKVEGNMSIGLFNSDQEFPEEGKAFKGVEQPIKSTKFTYSFSNVPNGNYAIALYQDSNKNRSLDKNFFGIPKELYGFSNDASGTFGPPDFKDASFLIKGNYTITITLK